MLTRRILALHRLFIRCGVVVLVLLAACPSNIARPPLVSEPPQKPHLPSEIELEEEEYGRAAIRREYVESASSDPHHDEKFNGLMESTDEKESPGVVAEILSFPFRAVGWLVSTLF